MTQQWTGENWKSHRKIYKIRNIEWNGEDKLGHGSGKVKQNFHYAKRCFKVGGL